MPPTFFIFLAFIVYIGSSAISLVLFVPMLFIQKKRLLAKKVLATVLISFPCLMVTLLFWALIFIIPALAFFWFIDSGYIPQIVSVILVLIGALIVAVIVAITSLYLWYFCSKIIYYRFDRKPIANLLNNDKVFNFIRRNLIKFRLYHPAGNYRK